LLAYIPRPPVSPSSHRSRTKREDPTLGHGRFNLEYAVSSTTSRLSASPRGVAHRSRARASSAAKRPSRLPTWLRHPTQWMQRAQGHRSRPHLCFLHHFALAFCWEGQGTRPARLLRPREQRIATLLLFVHTLATTGSLCPCPSPASAEPHHACLPSIPFRYIPLRDAQGTRDASIAKQSHLAACVLSACASNHLNRTHAREPGVLAASTAYPSRPRSRQTSRVWPPGRSTLDAFPRARSRQEAVRMPKASTSATYVWMLGN
jgi:hypothetical protein